MRARILSTVILLVWTVLTLVTMRILGGVLLLTLFSVLTQWELYQLMEKIGWKPYKKSAITFGGIILLGSFFSREGFPDFNCAFSLLILIVITYAVLTVLTGNPENLSNRFLPTLFGIFYIPIMFCIPLLFINKLTILWESNLALMLVFWIIIVAKFSDIGGLLIGKKFGKHKLAPAFSPQKTYEGLFGSILFSMAIGYIFASCCGNAWPSDFSKEKIGIISALIAIIALVSDLVESGFKRLAGVKDSGNTIPGIGGVFDLMDSLILSLPMGILLIKEFVLRF